MATFHTQTLSVTIDQPAREVTRLLADPTTHPRWATEFFAGPARPRDDEWLVDVPRMGGAARMRIEADVDRGIVDMFLAPGEAPFGPPLPIRVVPNGDGSDVLFTLARFPGTDDETWESGLRSMRRELSQLRAECET